MADHEIPEERQAAALRAVADAVAERDRLTAQAQAVVEQRAVEAARLGASRTRVRQVAGVSPRVFYRWLEDAGIPVRAKAPKGQGRRRKLSDD